MEAKGNYTVVMAIDFGTTFSGYAFAFTAKPDEIRMNKNWGELGFQVIPSNRDKWIICHISIISVFSLTKHQPVC